MELEPIDGLLDLQVIRTRPGLDLEPGRKPAGGIGRDVTRISTTQVVERDETHTLILARFGTKPTENFSDEPTGRVNRLRWIGIVDPERLRAQIATIAKAQLRSEVAI